MLNVLLFSVKMAQESQQLRVCSVVKNSDVKFFDKEGNFIGGDYSNIYVFDEWFIGENFRMSDEEVLELIFENRELRPLWGSYFFHRKVFLSR